MGTENLDALNVTQLLPYLLEPFLPVSENCVLGLGLCGCLSEVHLLIH